MSQSGRGLGRAGRGHDPRKTDATPKSKPGGRTGSPTRGAPQIGEPGPGFPQHSDVEALTSKTSGLKIGGGGDASAGGGGNTTGKISIGRGACRGYHPISVTEVVKTKPVSCLTKKGTFGTPISLLTNYFKLETMTDWVLYQYRVDFNVQEDRENVLRGWLRQHKDRLKTAYIFDGTMLFTSQRLTAENEPLTLTSLRESDNFPVQIDIKLVQQLLVGNAVYLQVFNILVRRCLLHLNLQLVNRNYFDPKASIPLLHHNIEIWPGYITAIRQHENDVLMCAEITHKVMRTDTALKLLAECTNESSDYRRLFQQSMIGSIVLTDYNNKTYRIDDVDFSVNPTCKFKYRNGEEISYVQYYEQRYQIRIKDLKQPLLISRATARDVRAGKDTQCLLVPELCRMTGLSARMLDNKNLMKNFAEVTRICPSTRIDRLKKFNQRLQDEPAVVEDFKQWGMKLSKDLVKVSGRLYPPEKIIAGNSKTYLAGNEVDWTRSMRSMPMLLLGKFEIFLVVYPYKLGGAVEEFLSLLKRAADGMHFRIPKPVLKETPTDSPVDMIRTTEHFLSTCNPDLIMFILTNDRGDRYSSLKKKCYVEWGVPSQVVLAKSLRAKGVMSIATKIAVQMNCKIGGAPWTVHIPADNVMVIGYDVCHDKTGRSKSVGAVVASLNKSMSAWYSTATQHKSGEELSDTLAADVFSAILRYREYNGNRLPQKIFFYRDGVGEGQVNYVYTHEVDAIKRRLTELYGGETWKLAYIIVTKRINTRFFQGGQNPAPGTIVDDVVTLPERYDFYLVSQSVRQGTVSPTSYNVISDNLDWGADYIQRFTYKMTHLYYNSSATVQVPAPCQYAHKLAFMVSQNLHSLPHPELSRRLYFL